MQALKQYQNIEADMKTKNVKLSNNAFSHNLFTLHIITTSRVLEQIN